MWWRALGAGLGVVLGLGGCALSAAAEAPGSSQGGGMPGPGDRVSDTVVNSQTEPAGGCVAGTTQSQHCGDGICVGPEKCDGCSIDCGRCQPDLQLIFTDQSSDAAVARSDGHIGALEATLLADLFSASERIEVAMYSLSRPSVIHALTAAAGRGVTVRVLTECENRAGADAVAFAELGAAGVEVRDDASSFAGAVAGCPEESGGRMHHKFIVIDGHLTWAGSSNLTWSDLGYNANAMLRIESTPIADAFGQEHSLLWAGRSGTEKSSRGVVGHRVGGALVEVAFSPSLIEQRAPARDLFLQSVAAAQRKIDFAAFYFTDAELAQALAGRSGLATGILDASGAASGASAHPALCAAGVAVLIENMPGKVHHKMLVVDSDSPGGSVIVGSANLSQSGFEVNDETVIRISDGALARQAAGELALLRAAPDNGGGLCVEHSAEEVNGTSPLCGERPCVCTDGLDNDYDGRTDSDDTGCPSEVPVR